jgi:ethanolamine utilization protein EutP (predicted NTPase)
VAVTAVHKPFLASIVRASKVVGAITKICLASSTEEVATIKTCLVNFRAGAVTTLSYLAPIKVAMDTTAVMGTMEETGTMGAMGIMRAK